MENRNGITELMLAAAKNDLRAVKALLAAGADVNEKDDFGNTALMYAVLENQPVMIEALLQAGADLHAKNQIGMTPLQVAKERDQSLGRAASGNGGSGAKGVKRRTEPLAPAPDPAGDKGQIETLSGEFRTFSEWEKILSRKRDRQT